MDRREYWVDLLTYDKAAFNYQQDRLPHAELINLNGIDLRGIDLRGACLKRVSLNGCLFADEAQFELAMRWGAWPNDARYDGGPSHPPTTRVTGATTRIQAPAAANDRIAPSRVSGRNA